MLSAGQAPVSLLCDFTCGERPVEKYSGPPKWDLCRWGISNQNRMWSECRVGLCTLYTAWISLGFLLLQADCLKLPSGLSADNLLPNNNQQKTNITFGFAVDSESPQARHRVSLLLDVCLCWLTFSFVENLFLVIQCVQPCTHPICLTVFR